MPSEWKPDVLGDGFEQLTLPLGKDEEGELVATLVRSLPRGWFGRRELRDVDILYVHGWSDYFFQRRLARFWTSRGARFFALDLRKYGRSLREGQSHGAIDDLAAYDEDIAAALGGMGERDGRRLVLLGHSAGGLVLSLWAARNPRLVDGLLLNSPWLEFQFGGIGRAALAPAVELGKRFWPHDAVPLADFGFYNRAQAVTTDPVDPMAPDPRWRPAVSPPITMAWLDAVLAGHAQVAKGLGIEAPVFVLLSARSALATKWSEGLADVDTVLAVDEVARAALKLGSSVSVERVDGALHDVFLSRHAVREEAYRRLDRWVGGYLRL